MTTFNAHFNNLIRTSQITPIQVWEVGLNFQSIQCWDRKLVIQFWSITLSLYYSLIIYLVTFEL